MKIIHVTRNFIIALFSLYTSVLSSSLYHCEQYSINYQAIVWDAKLSSDGKHIVAGGGGYTQDNYTVYMFDLLSPKDNNLFEENGDTVMSLSKGYSESGLSVKKDSALGFSYRKKHICYSHKEPITTVGWGPKDQNLISASEDGTVCLWNIKDHSYELIPHNEAVNDAKWSKYGSVFSATEGGKIYLNDIVKKRSTHFQAHQKSIKTISEKFQGESPIIASGGSDTNVCIWDMRFPKYDTKEKYTDPEKCITKIEYSPSGTYLAIGGDDKKVWIYETRNKQLIAKLEHDKEICGLCWLYECRYIATACLDRYMYIWDIMTRACIYRHQYKALINSIHCSAMSRRIITGHADHTILSSYTKVWPYLQVCKIKPSTSINSTAWSNEKNLFAVACENGILSLCKREEKPKQLFPIGHQPIRTLLFRFLHNSHIFFAGTDKKVYLYDFKKSKILNQFSGHTQTINQLIYAPTVDHLASVSDDGYIHTWDLRSQRRTHSLFELENRITTAQFMEGGKSILSGGSDCILRRWDLYTTKKISSTQHRSYGNTIESLSRQKDRIAVACGKNIVIWDQNNTLLSTHQGDKTRIRSICFLPNERIASAGNDGNIYIYNLSTPASYKTISGHTGSICEIATSSQAIYDLHKKIIMLSASEDSTVRLWLLSSLKDTKEKVSKTA